MFESVKRKKIRATHSVRSSRKGKNHLQGNLVLRAVLVSFVCGVAVCTLLLCIFAFLLANTTLPLTLVRPMSCAAAAMGVAVSSLIFSRQIGQRYLLCGLACGVFYAGCQLAAVWILHGPVLLQGSSLTLALVLLMSGLFGGALAAAWSVR